MNKNELVEIIKEDKYLVEACQVIGKLKGKAYLDASFQLSQVIGFTPTVKGRDGWIPLNEAISQLSIGSSKDFLASLKAGEEA